MPVSEYFEHESETFHHIMNHSSRIYNVAMKIIFSYISVCILNMFYALFRHNE